MKRGIVKKGEKGLYQFTDPLFRKFIERKFCNGIHTPVGYRHMYPSIDFSLSAPSAVNKTSSAVKNVTKKRIE